MFLSSFYYIILNYTLALLNQYHEYCLLFILLMQLVNKAQFLNITFLLAFFGAAAAASATAIIT